MQLLNLHLELVHVCIHASNCVYLHGPQDQRGNRCMDRPEPGEADTETRPPGDQQPLESAINCVSYLMVWIAKAARRRQNSKMLRFKITAAEIHFYAFSLWDHKALYSRSMKKVITT